MWIVVRESTDECGKPVTFDSAAGPYGKREAKELAEHTAFSESMRMTADLGRPFIWWRDGDVCCVGLAGGEVWASFTPVKLL